MRRLATADLARRRPGHRRAVRADSVGDVRTGNAAFGDGRYEAAVEAFTRAILAGDLPPEALAIAFNNRGVAYSELGDFDRAIGDCNQALALSPGDATAIRNLRIAYQRRAAAAARLGDRTAAQADYGRAIELEPTHPLAYLRRGQLALERGDRAAAIADLTKARDLDPDQCRHRGSWPTQSASQPAAGIEAQAAAPAPNLPQPAAPAHPEEANLEPPAVATPAATGPSPTTRSTRRAVSPLPQATAAAECRPGTRRRAGGRSGRGCRTGPPGAPGRQCPPGSRQRLSAHRLAGAGLNGAGGQRAPGLARGSPGRGRQRLRLPQMAAGSGRGGHGPP